jgi:hypothetical protein
MSSAVREETKGCAAGAKSFFRNPRFSHRHLLKSLYKLTAKWGQGFGGKCICVALDLVNLS